MARQPLDRGRLGSVEDETTSLGRGGWVSRLGRQLTLDADVCRDLAHAMRMLRRMPAFTALVLLMFATGIGAATALVSLADALILRPLPIPRVERVVTIWQSNRQTGESRGDVAPGNAIDWVARARSFESLAIAEPFSINATFDGREPEYLTAAFVSDGFFDVLGNSMHVGRPFLSSEYRAGAGRVAIFSYALWQERFGADPAIIGQAVRIDTGAAYTVVGVMPPRLELRLFDNRFTQAEPRLWLPKQGFNEFEPNLRGAGYWNVLGRLAPGVAIEQARTEFSALSAQLAQKYPETNANIVAELVPLRQHLIGSLHRALPVLLASAALLLVVACANVANLLLARGVHRGREFAVRQAVGASRGRLVRQMLVESLALAAAGGVAGLVFARWVLEVIARLRPMDVAGVDRIPIDVRAAAIACLVTIVAAIAAGLTPALQLSRPAASGALRDARSSPRRGARNTLVAVEVAAALVLAVGAGLLVRSVTLIQRVEPGFTADPVSVLQVFASPALDSPQKRIVFFDQALDRLRQLPGVVAAGGVTAMPFGMAKVLIRGPLVIGGRPRSTAEESQIYLTAVAGDYFRAMGIPLLKGRVFDAGDSVAARKVVLVSRSAARQFWPDGDPLGAKVQVRFTGVTHDAEVVGVVGDVRHEALDRPAAAELFLSYSLSGFRALTLVVRTSAGSPVTPGTLKAQIWAVDPRQSIAHTATLQNLISDTLVNRRFSLTLLGGFALAAVLLASAGVYGVMSFTISQRTREFGVRMALGAARGDIVRLVMWEGLIASGIGIAAGVALALPLMRVLAALLFGVTPRDPLTFLIVSAALMLVAAAACFVPASLVLRRAPVNALRAE